LLSFIQGGAVHGEAIILNPSSEIAMASFIIGIMSSRSSIIEKFFNSLSPSTGAYE